jgi:molybdopterin converting factor small subunit
MSTTFKALFFGPFRMITEQKEIAYTLSVPNSTINELVQQIIRDFPKLNDYFFTPDGRLSENTSIIVNGEDVRGLDGLATKIRPEDRITFFKAAGGG